jgi:hypothetical protein
VTRVSGRTRIPVCDSSSLPGNRELRIYFAPFLGGRRQQPVVSGDPTCPLQLNPTSCLWSPPHWADQQARQAF